MGGIQNLVGEIQQAQGELNKAKEVTGDSAKGPTAWEDYEYEEAKGNGAAKGCLRFVFELGATWLRAKRLAAE